MDSYPSPNPPAAELEFSETKEYANTFCDIFVKLSAIFPKCLLLGLEMV